MELGSHPPGPLLAGELMHAQVAEAVRQGVQLAKMDWDTGLSEEAKAEVEKLIESKVDKVKLWLSAIVIMNLLPAGALLWSFASFTTRIEVKLEAAALAAPGAETGRRLDELRADVDRLEGYHRREGQ